MILKKTIEMSLVYFCKNFAENKTGKVIGNYG